MKQGKLRRFSRFQIAFHWAVALPYMFLFASGGLIMLHRTGLVRNPAAGWIELLHRWMGIGLVIVLVQLLFAAVVSGNLKSILGDFLDWLLIRPRDVIWLIKAPLNTLLPRHVHMPAAGRFNAGQKIHGLFITAALLTFSVTGMLMVMRPALLSAWIVHGWFFYGAAGFLGLHLFLGLINPSTRRALGGIFTGYVPAEYVQDHHALEVETPESSHRWHAMVSVWALAGTWAAALVLAVGLTWWYGPDRAAAELRRVAGQEHAAISPGELIAAHADDSRMLGCASCHESMHEPSDSACLKCHTEMQVIMVAKMGFHGKLEGECRTCHADHKGRDADLIRLDTNSFNHEQARFKLDGKHQQLECNECHVEHSPKPPLRRFTGFSFSSCHDCHDDPHLSALGNDCAKCHSTAGWTGNDLRFDHNRDSKFQIDAVHRALACAQCHAAPDGGMQFRPQQVSCESCHAPVQDAMQGKFAGLGPRPADPHFGRVKCADCHVSSVASPTPARYAERCVSCHDPRYRELYYDWERSLDDRAHAAARAIRRLGERDAEESEARMEQLEQTRRLGIHNVQQIVPILRGIEESATNDLIPAPSGRSKPASAD